MNEINYFNVTFCFIVLFSCSAAANDSQEFTFIVEPAYTQEKGEWQINLGFTSPTYKNNISTTLETSVSLEYGFTDVLQAEFSSSRSNELEEGIDADMGMEYELGLSLMLTEQDNFMPQFTLVAGVIAEDSQYGYEAGLLYSYQILENNFIHGNFIYENIDNESEVAINLAYAFTLDESWTLLAEIERNKETSDDDSIEYVNTFSAGVVFETESDIEIGLAYLVYNADTLQDYSWQLKAAYEF
ncbi:hypothetical protein CXF85_10300 [Colwellia sp. 75C3]|uniref:hypothetical protein n=1 Tax=Colwellia sp. 75C3 TaxID=888425 RepID=UPI000C33E8AC|nr:hypothetical protein [Colwellia sp. 75C3]PKG83878.1 hypothetical protein CXF85_10300 [Colwellia sp. 75C3]